MIIDKRDGQSYKKVTIGNQVWMADNLNFKTEDSWCFGDCTNKNYGRTYTWDAAMDACPDGWHLPSDDEWKVLEIFLGMSKKHAKKWGEKRIINVNKFRSTEGFSMYTDSEIFWTSSLIDNNEAFFRIINCDDTYVFRFWTKKNERYHIRCVKN